jgi:hypothetical protein
MSHSRKILARPDADPSLTLSRRPIEPASHVFGWNAASVADQCRGHRLPRLSRRGGLPGGIPIFRGDEPIDPRLDFGVVEDNGRRVAAQFQRGLLTVPAYYCISKCPASAECAISNSA